jgi:hypothetical protein
MTKLASALPDGHGLESVRHKLIDEPRLKHIAVVVVDCSKVTIDYEKGGREPTAAIRTIEVVHPDDLPLTEQILTRGRDKRLGATVLPLDVEDDISAAFTGRSEDITTDLANDTSHLDEDQVKALASSLDQPLRVELGRAVSALRDSKDWVALGRARRVLQLAIRRLEENDKRLLRDEDGNLVDPETGDIVDEEKVTSEDLDRMLAAYFDQAEERDQELPLDGDEEPDEEG